ncbi:DUF4255 domain-containing protein [Tenacibaculum jejuense]|uniref:Pvc16 N-terminal domain-containing protein n=1 Tax=Tenacibaculum jejuense TaxID=584609 RepID=A0A238UD06_9FLAO|nr:DUF4255 domain-containing protein [Tenacibaculum jejuense]SNR16935.1 conserved protein of unknown function [Tenacibaculum jejuense]
MIHTALNILKDKLNEYFRIKTGFDNDYIKFIDSSNNDPVSFTNNVITPFLINISEDRKFRNADPYRGVVNNGIKTQHNPEIRVELLILFVSKFRDYNEALKLLSYVIKFFQANRVFTPQNSPELFEEDIEKLVVELITLPLEEQNQVWHSLNTSYLPSVLYKVRLLSFADEESIAFADSELAEIDIKTNQKKL